MKRRFFTSLLSVVLCAALLISCMPLTVFAESSGANVQMTAGDVAEGFVTDGSDCTSSDPSVAWIDENGSLNAMKAGTAVISDGTSEYTVTVGDYEDGSDVVGNLKILARYNDSMQFYDGHVYLLFTSYQDGVTVTVPDLYAAYEISDEYYEDIAEDISCGSNHTGDNAYDYFNLTYDTDSMTLNRGEIVTIGMYRGFDLTVPQAALGSVQNSSLWKELVAAGKASAVTAIFDYLDKGKLSSEAALARVLAIFNEEGLDYEKALDGVVEGGVCFNRELFNQKLEWDQYENVTYELDITRNQLDTMMMYLGGNNGNFSILKNSCATVALRAWNAAVGIRNGEPTSYYLTSVSDGIYSFIDAPKGVRDNIEQRLPGYYLNNAEGVAEPDAGYQDETGWVYVSAPEKVSPLVTIYDDTTIVLDSIATDISDLIGAAKGDRHICYSKDDQVIGVSVKYEINGEWTTISGVDFDINGEKISLTDENIPEDGVNFTYPYAEPAEGDYYYLLDQSGDEISGYYDEGYLCVNANTFPITYRVESAADEPAPPGLGAYVSGVYDSDATAEMYYKDGDEKIEINNDGMNLLDAGTKVFIKPVIPEDDDTHILSEIILNEENIMNGDHYDAEENAYFAIVPDEFVWLTVYFEEAEISLKGESLVQIQAGETIRVEDYVKLVFGYDDAESDNVVWELIFESEDGCAEWDEKELKGVKNGSALMFAYAAENRNICVLLEVEVHDSFDDMSVVTLSGDTDDYIITYTLPDDDSIYYVAYSGYRVDNGAQCGVIINNSDSKALISVKYNGKEVKLGETFTVEKDTEIKVEFAEALIKDLPKTVTLETSDDTYQLSAKVRYLGLNQFRPVYDDTVSYVSSDPVIAVDESGLITVGGEIPEGGCLAYVTAYAGSSNEMVSAVCKVVVGDYQGERIVGRLTVSARPIVKAQLISHAMITYTAYEDTDFEISYNEYYKPNEKFYELMQDYADNPDNYNSDPALYSDDELGLADRESYFDAYYADAHSDPQPVHLGAGESMTLSNYGNVSSPLDHILSALDDSTLATFSPQAQELIRDIKLYMADEDFDAEAAFDSLVSTLVQMFVYTSLLGFNPVDGIDEGGLMINKEAYNQFIRNDSQLPNNYYTVDITADELAQLKNYLSNPENNYYSLLQKSCSTSTVDIWNTTLSDRPELKIKGNYTGFTIEPMSIYVEVGLMKYKSDIDGEGGSNIYPRLVVLDKSSDPGDPDNTEDPEDPDDPDGPYPVYLGAWYMLGDADGDYEVSILDATMIQRYLAELVSEEFIDPAAANIGGDEVDILAATRIQRYLAEIDRDSYPIGEMFNRASGSPAETIEETVIVDTAGIKVTANSFGRGYMPYLNLTIENSSDKDAAVNIETLIINGFSTSADFVCETEEGEEYSGYVTVPAGETVQLPLEFNGTIMEESFMEFVAEIRMNIDIFDPDNFTVTASQNSVIRTSAYGVFDCGYDESGDVVFDSDNIRIVFKGVYEYDLSSSEFFISNQSDKSVFLNVKELKINSNAAEGVIGSYSPAGSFSLNSLGIFDEVNEGDEVEVTFDICERDKTSGDELVLYTAEPFSFTV